MPALRACSPLAQSSQAVAPGEAWNLPSLHSLHVYVSPWPSRSCTDMRPAVHQAHLSASLRVATKAPSWVARPSPLLHSVRSGIQVVTSSSFAPSHSHATAWKFAISPRECKSAMICSPVRVSRRRVSSGPWKPMLERSSSRARCAHFMISTLALAVVMSPSFHARSLCSGNTIRDGLCLRKVRSGYHQFMSTLCLLTISV
mmetsp:Transcript_147870/g.457255  ORF Transcript_147870/g.457255 Transcript_147870/m.457255 type:complete len:201 (+) Transcript_147870:308-910(+)